jgi:hypothetical protein
LSHLSASHASVANKGCFVKCIVLKINNGISVKKRNPGKIVFYALAVFFLLGSNHCAGQEMNDGRPYDATYRFDPAACDFPNYGESCSMDSWTGFDQALLLKKMGPPDEKGPDGSGGQYFLYHDNHSYREEFYVNAQGKIYSWQWQQANLNDNMNDFVALMRNAAFNNNCGWMAVPSGIQAKAMKTAAAAGVTLTLQDHFEPLFLCRLAAWYCDGIHGARDAVMGFQLYKIAAQFHLTAGQYLVGLCYAKGKGTPVNLTKARYWLQLAANQNYKPAVDELNQVNAAISSQPPPASP